VSDESAIDQSHLQALQNGEAAALNRLIARWQRPLHSFAYRYCQNRSDAEDLVAQTFVRLYENRMRLNRDTRLSAWLFTTLTNLCHNLHRWRRRHPAERIEAQEAGEGASRGHALVAEQDTPRQSLEHDEILASVRLAIGRLPHDLKVTLLLHHYDRLSYREIGAITGCSERGVETRLYRARQQLREMLAPMVRSLTD
jgi:RNA polymerase sigma-70 factor (ECF subfamily)